MINVDKLQRSIIRTKKLIATAVRNEDVNLIIPLRRLNREVTLVVAEFKCQKCGSEEKLQLHHLILRMAKKYMDLWRYIGSRHYWANQIILCKDCHYEFHTGLKNVPNRINECIIKEDYIKNIKKKYQNV